ncbi:MAG: molybdopterin-dependent oxidoreductase [Litoreibacter sp.]
MIFFRTLISAALISISTAGAVVAESSSTPAGEVILTVSGEITAKDGHALFDLDMLEAIDNTNVVTQTVWTDGTQFFEGVSLVKLMDHLGVTTGTILATAINDYTVEIPVSDAKEGGPIIAYRMNDVTMSVRDKGPLWIVYPYDDSSEFRTEVIYSRSIWQLDRITVTK